MALKVDEEKTTEGKNSAAFVELEGSGAAALSASRAFGILHHDTTHSPFFTSSLFSSQPSFAPSAFRVLQLRFRPQTSLSRTPYRLAAMTLRAIVRTWMARARLHLQSNRLPTSLRHRLWQAVYGWSLASHWHGVTICGVVPELVCPTAIPQLHHIYFPPCPHLNFASTHISHRSVSPIRPSSPPVGPVFRSDCSARLSKFPARTRGCLPSPQNMSRRPFACIKPPSYFFLDICPLSRP